MLQKNYNNLSKEFADEVDKNAKQDETTNAIREVVNSRGTNPCYGTALYKIKKLLGDE